MRRHLLVAVLVVSALPPTTRAADPPPLVRVVVLDTSGSMAGERLDTARKELLDLARKLPPAREHPLVVVPFTDRVGDVCAFTEPAPFEAYLNKLQAGGGTRIAAGLERALVEVDRYPGARHVCVLLYTDGEDSDQDGIAKQEERLDGLFAARQKRGLGQSVVFCKRWEQANAALLKQIAERGHAQVVDAGTTALFPVTLTPAVSVTAVRWAKDRPGVLEADWTASVTAVGLPKGVNAPGLTFTCRTSGAAGDTAAATAGAAPGPRTVRVPAPAAGVDAIELAFEVSAPAVVTAPGGLVLPFLAADRVRAAVRVPPRPVALALTAARDGPVVWVDPIRRVARVPVRVAVNTTGPAGEPWSGPLVVRPGAPAGSRIVAGTDTVTQTTADPAVTTVTVECALPAGTGVCPVELTVVPVGAPSGVSFAPGVARAAIECPPPAAVSTTLSTRVTAVGPARWVDLRHAVAAFTADVEVRVDGPLPPDSTLALRSPAGVRAATAKPEGIHPGTQTLRFEIEAVVPAAPQRATFAFDVLPPSVPDSVRIGPPAPVRIELTGPHPVRALLAQSGRTPAVLEAVARDGDGAFPLRVVPVLSGAGGAGKGLSVSVVGGSGLEWSGAERAWGIDAPAELGVRLPGGHPSSFFSDTVVEADVTVAPAHPTPAVVPSRQTVRVRYPAPVRRVAFRGTLGLAALLGVYFLARMVRRVSTAGAA